MTEPEAQQPDQEQDQPGQEQPARKAMSMEEKFPRGLWVRLIVYVAVGHLFAAFIYLLFSLGAQNQ
ncbi:DUF6126 family protein [Streptomyces sp. NPDC086554]|uniref:DUF6126 family protein n=1 Tax=Streptomyces sp. NPDC086554 TaxID=3154864 RepID=UPI00341B6C6C